jgi:hypothetical protein
MPGLAGHQPRPARDVLADDAADLPPGHAVDAEGADLPAALDQRQHRALVARPALGGEGASLAPDGRDVSSASTALPLAPPSGPRLPSRTASRRRRAVSRAVGHDTPRMRWSWWLPMPLSGHVSGVTGRLHPHLRSGTRLRSITVPTTPGRPQRRGARREAVARGSRYNGC